MPCQIEIHPFEVKLSIGCTPEERSTLQPVLLSLSIMSPEKFPASRTDRLNDTLDAAEVLALLRESVSGLRVHTLERLGDHLEGALRKRFVHLRLDWRVSLHKPHFGWTYVHAWRS